MVRMLSALLCIVPCFGDSTGWSVRLLAGTGDKGSADGDLLEGDFHGPSGIAVNSPHHSTARMPYVIVTDTNNHIIRRIDTSSDFEVGQVTTIAGRPGLVGQDDHSKGIIATFSEPEGISIHPQFEYALVADRGNHLLRRVSLQTTEVRTIAGTGRSGHADGEGLAASFSSLTDVSISSDGSFAVICDMKNHVIRRIELNTNVVSTLAGQSKSPGYKDRQGLDAMFYYPTGLEVSPDSTYSLVADQGNNKIRILDLGTAVVKTLQLTVPAGQKNAWLSAPSGIVIDSNGMNAFVTDTGNNRIVRLELKIEMGSAEMFALAGQDEPGNADGYGQFASFFLPHKLALTHSGQLLVADTNNNLIRIASPPTSAPTPAPTSNPTKTTPTPTAAPTLTPTPAPTVSKAAATEAGELLGSAVTAATVTATVAAGAAAGPALTAIIFQCQSIQSLSQLSHISNHAPSLGGMSNSLKWTNLQFTAPWRNVEEPEVEDCRGGGGEPSDAETHYNTAVFEGTLFYSGCIMLGLVLLYSVAKKIHKEFSSRKPVIESQNKNGQPGKKKRKKGCFHSLGMKIKKSFDELPTGEALLAMVVMFLYQGVTNATVPMLINAQPFHRYFGLIIFILLPTFYLLSIIAVAVGEIMLLRKAECLCDVIEIEGSKIHPNCMGDYQPFTVSLASIGDPLEISSQTKAASQYADFFVSINLKEKAARFTDGQGLPLRPIFKRKQDNDHAFYLMYEQDLFTEKGAWVIVKSTGVTCMRAPESKALVEDMESKEGNFENLLIHRAVKDSSWESNTSAENFVPRVGDRVGIRSGSRKTSSGTIYEIGFGAKNKAGKKIPLATRYRVRLDKGGGNYEFWGYDLIFPERWIHESKVTVEFKSKKWVDNKNEEVLEEELVSGAKVEVQHHGYWHAGYLLGAPSAEKFDSNVIVPAPFTGYAVELDFESWLVCSLQEAEHPNVAGAKLDAGDLRGLLNEPFGSYSDAMDRGSTIIRAVERRSLRVTGDGLATTQKFVRRYSTILEEYYHPVMVGMFTVGEVCKKLALGLIMGVVTNADWQLYISILLYVLLIALEVAWWVHPANIRKTHYQVYWAFSVERQHWHPVREISKQFCELFIVLLMLYVTHSGGMMPEETCEPVSAGVELLLMIAALLGVGSEMILLTGERAANWMRKRTPSARTTGQEVIEKLVMTAAPPPVATRDDLALEV